MAKKSSALEKLQSKRKATGRNIDASAILGKREKPVSRSAGIEQTPEEAQAEEHAILSQFINPYTGSKKDPVSNLDSVSKKDTVSNKDPESKKATVSKKNPAPKKDPAYSSPSTTRVLPLKKSTPKSSPAESDRSISALIPGLLVKHGNQKVKIENGYTAVSWAVDDILAAHQTTSEQSIYRQLYRLSVGFGNTLCFVGNTALEKRCNMTKTPLKTALNGLKAKKHIEAVATFNEKIIKGTIYRVFLPHEIKTIAKLIPESKEKDTGVNLDPVSKSDSVFKSDTVSQDTGSKLDSVSKSDPIKNESNKALKSDIKNPGSHPVQTTYSVREKSVQKPTGENQVFGNLALSVENQWEIHPEIDATKHPYLTPQEQSYIDTLPSQEQSDIFDAQDLWDDILGARTRPPASKLNTMLGHIRRVGYKDQNLNLKFQECLEKTKQKNPKDPVAWLMAAFVGARYP